MNDDFQNRNEGKPLPRTAGRVSAQSGNPRLRLQQARAQADSASTPADASAGRGVPGASSARRPAARPGMQPGAQPVARVAARTTERPAAQPVRTIPPAGTVLPVAPGQARNGQRGAHASNAKPQKKKGRLVWRIVFWVALLVFAVSMAALAYLGFTYWQGQNVYDGLADEAFEAPADVEGSTVADFNVDWEALRAVNEDVVGWIYIPGTVINYPMVHRPGDDSYYLVHNFNGETTGEYGAEYGSIMLSGENEGDFSDTVNIIYGHHMSNGMMFAELEEFKTSDVFNEHRTVYLFTPEGNYLLKTFAIVHVAGTDTTIVIPNFGSDEDRIAYMQDKIDRSLVAPDPACSPAAEIERAFALSTCDGVDNSYRYIVYCEIVDFAAVGSSAEESSSEEGTLVNPEDVGTIEESTSDRVS